MKKVYRKVETGNDPIKINYRQKKNMSGISIRNNAPATTTNEILLQGWISGLLRLFNHTLIFTGCLTPSLRK
jgi:hypothetical protein